jgi:hypothetical protein
MTASEEEDFLWSCAFFSNPKDRLYIIPDGVDLDLAQNTTTFGSNTFLCAFQSVTEIGDIKVNVTEERGHGVIDIIGGEVWEAALLLCGYIMKHLDSFLQSNTVLELGSGAGLPALLLVHLASRHDHTATALQRVLLSDYDLRVLHNLIHSINHNWATNITIESPGAALAVQVMYLDWNCAQYPMNVNKAMGAALCYAPAHAVLLERVIR